MTDEKESTPESSSSFTSSSVPEERVDHLHLDVPPAHHHSSTSQASPRSSSGRGSSSTSSLSIGQISYRDLPDIHDEFKVVKTLYDGAFSKILLAKTDDGGGPADPDEDDDDGSSGKRRRTNNNKYLVLKAIPSGGLFTDDFKRELRYNYFLSPHPNIVTSFNISFNWASCFNVYVQEYAPFGDLSRYINRKLASSEGASSFLCLPESQVKLMASQVASALEFMHSFKLVHQDLRAENVLIFKSNLSRVKLCDFGSTRREATLITKGTLISSSSSNLLSPEISYLLPQERFECHRSADVWQMGILLCFCLTGGTPWQSAEFTDPLFRQYTNWLKKKSLKLPEFLKRFSPRMVRLLKRLLEPKAHLRSEIREVFKYLGDEWLKPNYRFNTVPPLSTTLCRKSKKGSLKSDPRVKKPNKCDMSTTAGFMEKRSRKQGEGNDDSAQCEAETDKVDEKDSNSIIKSWVGNWVASTSAEGENLRSTHQCNDDDD